MEKGGAAVLRWRRRIAYLLALFCFALINIPWVRSLLTSAGKRWLFIFLLATSLSYLLGPATRWLARRTGILDLPDLRKVHKNPTPLLGGLGIFAAFFLALVSNHILNPTVNSILFGAVLMTLVGAIDDKYELPASLKLGVQVVAVGGLIIGGVYLRLLPQTPVGNVVNYTLTFLWIVGITNALNFLDGMDGLATGLSAIIAFFLGMVAFQTRQPFFGWMSIALMGACLGFLPYNFKRSKPAEMFLGDSGSTFLGFTLSALAVAGEWSETSAVVSFAAPLLIFSVLIFDMIHITVTRIASGNVRGFQQWISYVGRDHLHHRLRALLQDDKRAVLLIYSWATCFGIAAVVLRNARILDAILLIVQAILLTLVFTVLELEGNRWISRRRPH